MVNVPKNELLKLFGNRVRFDQAERKLYSRDIADLPRSMGLMVKLLPDAVVQPINKNELKALIDLASEKGNPLTPRGAGTSGTGGVLPVKGGVVVDLCRMNRLLSVNKDKLEIIIEPGIVWGDLEGQLGKQGLQLRLYPSSAPSSTAGGWVAQGGIGIGSCQFGSIQENVVSVEILTPKGHMTMSGSELDVVTDCLGSTGIITSITLKVMPYQRVRPFYAAFPSLDAMCKCMEEVVDKIPLWSGDYASPEFIQLLALAAEKKLDWFGKDEWLGGFQLHEDGFSKYDSELTKIVINHSGRLLTQDKAQEVWEDRFNPMRLKRLGPSLVPGEVYVPLDELGAFLKVAPVSSGLKQFPVEGTLASRTEATALCLALDDSRRSNYTLAWGFSMGLVRIARKFGGRAYGIGAYLQHEAIDFYGADRFVAIQNFKSLADPEDILNPGKIATPSIKPFPLLKLNSALAAGSGVLSALSKAVPFNMPQDRSEVVDRDLDGWGGIERWDLLSCTQCGFCREVCPVYIDKKWESSSPRGKLAQFEALSCPDKGVQKEAREHIPEGKWADDVYCTLCGKCETVCPVDIPFHRVWEELRCWMNRRQWGPPAASKKMFQSIDDPAFWNPFREPREKRTEWYPPEFPIKEKADIVYFAGCMSSYHEYQILQSTMKLFLAAGVDITTMGTDEKCCAAVDLFTGQPESFKAIAKYNVEQILKRGASTVVTGCPACYRALFKYKKYTDCDLEVLHSSELLYRLVNEGKLEFTKPFASSNGPVAYHDPCELGRIPQMELGRGIYEEPRFLLESIPGLELLEFDHNRKSGDCCGGGGGLKAIDYDLTARMTRRRIDDGIAIGARTIASMCNNCKNQMAPVAKEMKRESKASGKKLELNIKDISEILAKAL